MLDSVIKSRARILAILQRVANVSVLLAFTAGCAYTYVDEHNVRHVVGVVKLKIRDAPENGTWAGKVVDSRSLGITVSRSDMGGSVSLGYNRDVTGYLKNHSLVVGDPYALPNVIDEEESE